MELPYDLVIPVLKCLSVNERIKQLWDINTMEYYSAIKKKKILPFVTAWMDLENIILSEISRSYKDKYHYDFIYMWNLRNKQQNRDRHII